MTKHVVSFFVVASIAVVFAVPVAHADRPEDHLRCAAIPNLVTQYLDAHVVHHSPDDDLVDRAVTLYADGLDPTKALLTAPEFDRLRTRLGKAFRRAIDGDCVQLETLLADQQRWHQDMKAYVDKLLTPDDLEIDRSIVLQLDPDKRPRPQNAGKRDALRRELVHFQLANLVRGGVTLADAKQKLRKRYELVVRRIGELDVDDLYTGFLNAYAAALDPHSSYFSAEMLEDFRIGMELSLEGIGAVLSSRDGFTIVQEIVPGGAADREGELQVNDKIIAVAQGTDGEAVDVIDMDLRDVVRKIRGKRGTTVKLTVLRQSKRHEIAIVRDKIDIKEQAAKLRWETVERKGRKLKLAVLELPSFYGGGKGSRDSATDVRELLKEVAAQHADGLVLDLSRNGGGLLDSAVEISGLFLVEGPIVGVEGDGKREVLRDEDKALVYSGPLVVLTSRISASASEIVAGALQDYRRAVIVGDDHTFGKGSVQTVVTLRRGLGALKVTIGMFFLPGGHSTQSRGVRADVVVPSLFSAVDIGETFQPYALPARRIDAFKGEHANADTPAERWVPVTPKMVKRLAKRSAARVAKDRAFKELARERAKLRKNEGTITIAELMDDTGDADPATDPTAEADAPDPDKSAEPTPQQLEATEILADLVVM